MQLKIVAAWNKDKSSPLPFLYSVVFYSVLRIVMLCTVPQSLPNHNEKADTICLLLFILSIVLQYDFFTMFCSSSSLSSTENVEGNMQGLTCYKDPPGTHTTLGTLLLRSLYPRLLCTSFICFTALNERVFAHNQCQTYSGDILHVLITPAFRLHFIVPELRSEAKPAFRTAVL